MGTLFDKLASGQEVEDIDSFEGEGDMPDPETVAPAPPRADVEPPIKFAGAIRPPEEEAPRLVGTIAPPDPTEPVPDFLKTIYRREDWPAEGFTSWYLKPSAPKPAFVENPAGAGLHFEDSRDPDALRAGLILAQERGWIPAKLNGTPEFCSRAFLAAAELGIRTSGYLPTPDDLKTLEARGLSIPTIATSIPPAVPVMLAVATENEQAANLDGLMNSMDWRFNASHSPEIRVQGSESLDKIIDSLEKLAAASPAKAGALWDKYAPADFYRPHYLPPPAPELAKSRAVKEALAVRNGWAPKAPQAPGL